jgi:hypothetical protein
LVNVIDVIKESDPFFAFWGEHKWGCPFLEYEQARSEAGERKISHFYSVEAEGMEGDRRAPD